NAIELAAGMPRRKSTKSLPAAAPVKVNVPRAFCCERRLNCCFLWSTPYANECRPRFQLLLKETALDWLRSSAKEPLDKVATPLAKIRVGGPQFLGSRSLPEMRASPEISARVPKYGRVRATVRLN